MTKIEFKTDGIWMIDFSEELASFVIYHKCGAITIVPESAVNISA